MSKSPQACLVCFSINVKLFSLNSGTLRTEFELLSGVHTYEEGLLEYLCYECMANVRRFIKFRDKCKRAVDYLLHLSQTEELSKTHLLLVNRKDLGIMPDLSYMNVENMNYKEITFKSVTQNQEIFLNKNCIPILHYGITDSRNEANVTHLDVELIDTKTGIKSEDEDLITLNTRTAPENDEFVYEYVEFQIDDNDDNLEDVIEDKDKNTVVKTEEEYAYLHPITLKEAKAAAKVSILYQRVGDFNCAICKKSFNNVKSLNDHLRMHDIHISGTFHCNICNYYYKTDCLLQSHIREKHMYKYVCKQCPEVNFDRSIAKQHFVLSHLNKRDTMGTDWYEIRPSWLKKKTFTKPKPSRPINKPTKKPVEKSVKKGMTEDFFDRTPISQEEQYRMVHNRMRNQNYIRSLFKCELCYRGFQDGSTYDRHMHKHDPAISGKYECDMCKLRFKNTRKVYNHMNRSHLFKYSCLSCDYVSPNVCQALNHYRWHQNVTYPCSFCDKLYKKQSSLLSHVRINHPSMCMCRLCGHSFVTENGLNCHIKISHKNEESALCESMQVDKTGQFYCADCDVQFLNQSAFTTHLGSSNKHVTTNISSKNGRTVKAKQRKRKPNGQASIVNNCVATPTNCELCGKLLPNDVETQKHYELEHPGTESPKGYMCDVCGHTTTNYHYLMQHMRSHTKEKPYKCPRCDKMFSQLGNMKRHLIVHTGDRRFVCEHCNRRFAQKVTLKLHVQTFHFKMPYPLCYKKNRERRSKAKSLANAASEAPACSVATTVQKLAPQTQGAYFNAYVSSLNDFVG